LRYYASEAERIGDDVPPCGIFTTIAPWNFPLAIFLGQISAALAAGNAVLAKPAEATCLIADLATSILHKAGVPETALQCLPGEGHIVGAALTSDPRISGICFTGSTATAQIIHKSAASHLSPSAPLIAETGGINAMIVDSTALPQQAIGDIITSAFQSAGQRCSALRLLYVQDDIADNFLAMLTEAMEELSLSVPWSLASDIGPVINQTAFDDFSEYVAEAKKDGKLIHQMAAPKEGHFIGPALIKANDRKDVIREIFGPILHVARFSPEDIPSIISDLNAADYSLTFGLHTRIDGRVEDITQSLRVGNIYVNRNQIGAIVGSQPFGGNGLSGTGPKAGGPSYLPRFYKNSSANLPDEKPSALSLAEAQKMIDAVPRSTNIAREALTCPGPTGESNVLSLYAKGRIICCGPDAKTQAELIKAQGCTPVMMSGLNPRHLEHLAEFDGVIHWGSREQQSKARQALARREGPILPLICSEAVEFACFDERHVCIDMTASGGNAELLVESS